MVFGRLAPIHFFKKRLQKNIIFLLATGPEIAVYANDHLIHFERDLNDPHLFGQIGFYITGGSNLFLDNLTIQPIDIGFYKKYELPNIFNLENEPFIK